MKISDEQIQILLRTPAVAPVEAVPNQEDRELIEQVKEAVMAMPDREDMIARLRAAIEAGEYNPTANEIAEAMIRRAIADRIR